MPNPGKGCKGNRAEMWTLCVDFAWVARFFTSLRHNLAQKGNLLENTGADWALLEE